MGTFMLTLVNLEHSIVKNFVSILNRVQCNKRKIIVLKLLRFFQAITFIWSQVRLADKEILYGLSARISKLVNILACLSIISCLETRWVS